MKKAIMYAFWFGIAALFLILIPYNVGYNSAKNTPAYHVGDVPIGVPVVLFWVNDDGVVTGTSAIKTDYAGVFPYSTTGHAVPYMNLESWSYWTYYMEVNP